MCSVSILGEVDFYFRIYGNYCFQRSEDIGPEPEVMIWAEMTDRFGGRWAIADMAVYYGWETSSDTLCISNTKYLTEDSYQSDSDQSDSYQSDSDQCDSDQSDSNQSDSDQSDSYQSDSHQSDSDQSYSNKSYSNQSYSDQSDFD